MSESDGGVPEGADMQDGDDSRPISVAELLARNGTIGAPPVGGRRRRRRGNSAAVTVAELTGEIPVIRDEPAPAEPADEADEHAPEEAPETPSAAESAGDEATDSGMVIVYASGEEAGDDSAGDDDAGDDDAGDDDAADDDAADDDADDGESAADREDEPVDEPVEETSETAADVEVAEERVSPPPLSADPLPRRRTGPELSHDPRPVRRSLGAEQMAPDPVDQPVDLAGLVAEQDQDVEELRSYLKSSGGTLFGGQSMADDLARRGIDSGADDGDLPMSADAAAPVLRPAGGRGAALRHGAIALGQSALAVVFGAGLFIAFDQLWRWNNLVALVLSVLVILGLVVAVRVVRKTEDIASTLIAVAVGALVTLGPLALLQST